ncbi:nucleotidyltransferase substrate binding protein [Salinibius halmophilus]|uniref:nucleotidyltransferase substrate binding protein n=1 Tax=Salinibius halmophilus TaxID=1853216 RepID=UPI000E66693A|nr:nucleotidyltransferase substrate binding protein [Salinibius halmophilus]
MTEDIRWLQRFSNYKKALAQLSNAVALKQTRDLSDLETQGLIQAFEFTHELAWNVLKDFLTYQGEQEIFGSRDATRKAFEVGLVNDGSVWMQMIASRNRTSHTYNAETAEAILQQVVNAYHSEFQALALRFDDLAKKYQ